MCGIYERQTGFLPGIKYFVAIKNERATRGAHRRIPHVNDAKAAVRTATKNGLKRANLLNPLMHVSHGELPCKRLRCDDAARLLFTAHGGGSHHDLGNILLAGEVEHRLL